MEDLIHLFSSYLTITKHKALQAEEADNTFKAMKNKGETNYCIYKQLYLPKVVMDCY